MKKQYVAFATEKIKTEFEKIPQKKLYKAINKTIDQLKQNPHTGIKISQKLGPKEYKEKHDIKNLYTINLPQGWRLLYTIQNDEIIVLSIILDWLDHKKYERKFKY